MVFRLTLMLIVGVAFTLASSEVGAAAVITVEYNGGADFTSIQAAIDAANPGDEIHVASGTYIENLDVYKQVTLIGEGTEVVFVQAADPNEHIFDIIVDSVEISGFTVTGTIGTWKAGIKVEPS